MFQDYSKKVDEAVDRLTDSTAKMLAHETVVYEMFERFAYETTTRLDEETIEQFRLIVEDAVFLRSELNKR